MEMQWGSISDLIWINISEFYSCYLANCAYGIITLQIGNLLPHSSSVTTLTLHEFVTNFYAWVAGRLVVLMGNGKLRALRGDLDLKRKKKGNIWFQKAEVQIEATPMLLFPAEQPNKLLCTSTSSSKSFVLLELSEGTAVMPQSPLWGQDCWGYGRGCFPTLASWQHQHTLHLHLSSHSREYKELCRCWKVLERVKLLYSVHLTCFQQLVQADTGSSAVKTLLTGTSPAQYLCACWSGCTWEPGSSWEHPVLVPFHPCFLIPFFSCTNTRVKAVFLELSGSSAFQAWGFF